MDGDRYDWLSGFYLVLMNLDHHGLSYKSWIAMENIDESKG